MVKTHKDSRFTYLSLQEIKESMHVILQLKPTKSHYIATKEPVYLCEIVSRKDYFRKDVGTECIG